MVNTEINTISNKLKEVLTPEQIYLFGSYAKNTYNSDSDYDFYLIVSDNAGNVIELTQKAYRSLRGIRKTPVDIIVNHKSAFHELSQQESLEKIVKKEGILLYAK